jgi:hypothetical protein
MTDASKEWPIKELGFSKPFVRTPKEGAGNQLIVSVSMIEQALNHLSRRIRFARLACAASRIGTDREGTS